MVKAIYIFVISFILQFSLYRLIKEDAEVTMIDMLGVSLLMAVFTLLLDKFLLKKKD